MVEPNHASVRSAGGYLWRDDGYGCKRGWMGCAEYLL